MIKSKRKIHINGHKLKTLHRPIIDFCNDRDVVSNVYYPCISPGNKEMNILVKIGDNVKVGDIISLRKDFYIPSFSSVSGKVIEMKNIFYPCLGRDVQHVVIENDFLYTKGEDLPILDINNQDRKEIIDLIKNAGIVGMGGSGFPTYIKYLTDKKIDTLIINGVECEPYLTTDQVEATNNAKLVFQGAQILTKAADAKVCLIVIKKGKIALKDALEKEIKNHENIYIKEVEDKYPMGWEREIIRTLLKKDYDKLPSEAGIIVNNIQTAIYVAKALMNGEKISKRVITFSGNGLLENANVLLPIGALIKNVVEKLGGYKYENISIHTGGPMTGKSNLNDNFAVIANMGGITFFKKTDEITLPCLGCGRCIDFCPIDLQPIKIAMAFKNNNIELLKSLEVEKCCECGLCSYVCPSKIELADTIKKAKMYVNVLEKNKKDKGETK